MGPKICPSTPCMVNRGTKPATVINAENRTALSTWSALTRIIRKRSVQRNIAPASACSCGWVRPPRTSRKALQQSLSFFGVSLKISKHVLNQDYRRIDIVFERHGDH